MFMFLSRILSGFFVSLSTDLNVVPLAARLGAGGNFQVQDRRESPFLSRLLWLTASISWERLMQYRQFGKLGWKVSVLGFGAMRLPILDGDFGTINELEATKMIRFAIDHGVNYVDTAYPYHRGNSEAFLSSVLQDGYRQKVRIATKMPTWLIHSQGDMNKYLDEQLSKLKMDRVDFYLLHGMNRER
jgi:hypothetical protein